MWERRATTSPLRVPMASKRDVRESTAEGDGEAVGGASERGAAMGTGGDESGDVEEGLAEQNGLLSL